MGVLFPVRAGADPLFEAPVLGRLSFGESKDDPLLLGLLVDVRFVGVVDGNRLAYWPDRQWGLESGEPQLLQARVGCRLDLRQLPLSLVLRADPAELSRPFLEDDVGRKIGAITDDLYLRYQPFSALGLAFGRAPVPWSKLRQFDELDQPLGGPAFLVDRVAPDRRWGGLVLGDLGALSYAAGLYADRNEFEPRARIGDPSQDGQLLGMAHAEWTPIAPMMGGNPPGKIHGARGPLPTPRSDPWYATPRVSLGMGELWRRRADGSLRSDLSVSAHVKWRWLAGLAELICTDACKNDAAHLVSTHGQLMATPTDRVAMTLRLEWDAGLGAKGTWALGLGTTYHVTQDRRSKIALIGWLQSDRARGTRYDGAVVLLQTSL